MLSLTQSRTSAPWEWMLPVSVQEILLSHQEFASLIRWDSGREG